MSDTLYLVLDQGGQASRALIFDDYGESLAHSRVEQKTDINRANLDPAMVVASLRKAATAAISQLTLKQRTQPIRAALICQRSACLCWDRVSGQPLSPLIGWQDRSGQATVERLKRHHTEIQRISGLTANAHTPAAKWSEMLRSSAFKTAQQNFHLACGNLATYLMFHLCREHPFLIDRVNAARTQLYSLDTQNWSLPLCALFDIPPDYLPAIQPCLHRFGTLEIAGSRIPLKLVCGDQSTALFSNGWPCPTVLSINMGTGVFLQMPLLVDTNERPITPLLVSPAYSDDTETIMVLEGTVNGGASALNLTSLPLGLNYHASGEWRERYQPPPLFVNGIGGVGSPDWCSLDSGWQGLPPFDPKSKVLAVAESILFMVQRNLNVMRDVGSFPGSIHLSGGLGQLDWMAQGISNLSNLNVHRFNDPEASARGAAWLLSSRSKHWRRSPETLFMPASHSALPARFQRWSNLLHTALQLSAKNR